MKRNPFETILGIAVILIAGVFFLFAYSSADLKTVQGYSVKASFLKVGGLEKGADVRINGIKVGSITDVKLNNTDYTALVTLSLKADIKIPTDTEAQIAGDGLMGGKMLKLIPGIEKEYIKPEGFITKTKDYKSLEDSVSEIIFLVTDSGKKE